MDDVKKVQMVELVNRKVIKKCSKTCLNFHKKAPEMQAGEIACIER
eukprot:gene12441-6193_t